MLVSGQSIYVGSSDISEVYQGSDLIWSKGGGQYYYYYQSMDERDIDVIAANFENVKEQGPSVTSTTEFSYYTRPNYSGGTKVTSVMCFAIPDPLTIVKVMAKESQSATGTDITSRFTGNVKNISIGEYPYLLYYRLAMWGGEYLTVTVE